MMFDAVRFCRDFNISYIPPGASGGKVSTGWIGLKCPNPKCNRNDQPDYGGFNIYGGYYSCWSCGGHSLTRVIRWYLRIGNHEAQDLIWNYSGSAMMAEALNHKKKTAGKVKKIDLPGSKLMSKHKAYLQGRGFDPEYLIKKYGLRAVGNKAVSEVDNKYKNRIIIPIHDRHNKVISFQGRSIRKDEKLRYKGCEIERSVVNYKHTLYGLNHASDDKFALVEGVVDQWAMGDGFLSTFGTAVTEHQIRVIASNFKTGFILFDPEKTAQEMAEKVAVRLASLNIGVEIIVMDSDLDPGELSESDRKYIRRELGFV